MDTAEHPVTVVVADDHHIFREGLRALLTAEGMTVVGEADNGDGAVEAAREHQPDVVVLDLGMPERSGLEALAQIKEASERSQIVVLTVSAQEADVARALAAGASSYLLKDMHHDELAGAIRLAAAGHTVLSAEVARGIGAGLTSSVVSARRSEPDGISLTPREMDVIRLLAVGADNARIGRELSISRHTVKQYVTSICKKIGVQSRVQAAVYAVRHGLV